MIWARPARVILTLVGAAALAIGFSALEVGARPKQPPVVEAPPPPPAPPPMPDVFMSPRLVTQAAAYAGYMRSATQISPNFDSGLSVSTSLRQGAAYEPSEFVHGAVAYAALAALQDPTFVAAVRAAGSTAENRYTIVSRIFQDPGYAFAFKGADAAAGLAKTALIGQGTNLFNDGVSVKMAAYSMQHQAWSKEDVPERPARLATVKTLSSGPIPISPEDAMTLQRAASGSGLGLPPATAAPPYSRMIKHALALAALAAIGQAGDDNVQNLGWLDDDSKTSHCVAEAKENLYQCLAVARPNYEDVFCLGQHALADTGACVVQGAGGAIPLEVSTKPMIIPPVHGGVHHKVKRRRA
ncbi:MAG: hypothetical protein ACHP84_09105 [Caulobacterales bacterium]